MKKLFLITLLFLGIKVNAQTVVNPQNAKNPYDNIGLLHNEALDYVESKVSFSQSIDFKPIIADFLTTKFSETEVAKFRQSKPLAKKKLSEVSTKYYTKLNSIVSTKATIGEVMSKIIDLENLILINKPKIPTAEFKSLLAATSTARYSYFFWTKKDNANQPPTPSYRLKLPKWIKVIVADVRGVIGSKGDTTCEVIGDAAEKSCEAAQ